MERIIQVRVLTNHPITEEEFTKEFLEAEQLLNHTSKLRFHIISETTEKQLEITKQKQ